MSAAAFRSLSRLAIVLAGAGVSSAQNVTLESASSTGIAAGNFGAQPSALTRDGRFVVFQSVATNLVPGDTNFQDDVFLRDRTTGALELVSRSTAGAIGDGVSNNGLISADGRFVVFLSSASNFAGGGLSGGLFLRDRQLGTTAGVPVSALGQVPNGSCIPTGFSPDGRWIAFHTWATNVVAGDANGFWDVFVHDRQQGTTAIASLSSAGTQGNGNAWDPSVSADGRVVVFSSGSNNLVAGDGNSAVDVFARDLAGGTTELVSVALGGASGNLGASDGLLGAWVHSAVSDDGRFVAFGSASSDLVAGDTNGLRDVFVRDRALAVTTRVSLAPGGAEATGASDVLGGVGMSGDARFVTFSSDAANLVPNDGNGTADVFVHDSALGVTARANVDLAGQVGPGTWTALDLSDDGRFVLFGGDSHWLVIGDEVVNRDHALVRDMQLTGPAIALYCTAKSNSSACLPFIGANGAPSASGNDAFFLIATLELPGKSGVFFWGRASASLPFGGGTLCVAPPLVRGAVQDSGGSTGCTGTYSHHFSHAYMAAHNVLPGDTLYGQFWSRDPGFAPPNNVALTRGIQFAVLP